LLAFCLASVLVARGQLARVATAEAGAQAAQAEAAQLDHFAQRVRQLAAALVDDPHAGKGIDLALAETVASAMLRRVESAISIEALTVSGGNAGSRVAPVTEMAKPLALSAGRLRAISLRIKGSYGHFDGLRAYVDGFRSLPVAITGFSAADRSFELTLTVFGG
jgi:hypothetical protein